MNKDSIELINSFGLIIENSLVIRQYGLKSKINIDELKHVSIRKARVVSKNVYMLMLLGLVYVLLVYFDKLILRNTFLFYILGIGLLFLYKDYNYAFIITTKKNDVIKFSIPKRFKNDAKEVLKELRVRIRKGSTQTF